MSLKLVYRLFGMYAAAAIRNKRQENAMRNKFCELISSMLGATFTAEAISLKLSGSVIIKGMRLAYANGLTLSAGYVNAKVSLRNMLRKRINVTSLRMDEVMVSVVRAVADAPVAKEPAGTTPSPLQSVRKHYRRAFRMLHYLFNYWPAQVSINNVKVLMAFRGREHSLHLKSLQGANGAYTAAMQTSYTGEDVYTLSGKLLKPEKLFTIDELRTPQGQYGLDQNEKFNFSIKKTALYEVEMECMAGNCEVFNQRLSREKVFIDCFEARVYCALKDNSLVIDKRSELRWNYLRCNFQVNHLFPDESLRANIVFPQSEPADFLRSFPGFSCKDIYELDYLGKLAFEMNLLLFIKNPSQYVIKANILKEQFSVGKQEGSVFESLKAPFIHPVYKDEKVLKLIELNTGKNGFVAFRDMPSILHKIVVETEDPNFFTHRGVDPFFMINAFVQNMKSKRIERGGSTITMQLARNLYLGHSRNMFRKVEEIVIAWLMEDVFKVSKERILEIYFNIIEFAPDVYGISEASHYYFSKPAKELSITECIVLSYIIPRPKHFDEALQISSEKLNRNLKGHIQRVTDMLLSKGIISRSELNKINFKIPIRNKVLQLS